MERDRVAFRRPLVLGVLLVLGACGDLFGPGDHVGAVFVDGEAQDVPAFADSTQWIRHELWVETEFDSDGDGLRDRMHVAVVRPKQTETEGLKVAVVYESGPYFGGTVPIAELKNWSVEHELGATPPPREPVPAVQTRVTPGISSREVATWVPRGFAVVHSEAPGTGLSQGCPTVGGSTEGLAPKAVIDWLNGRARGYTTVNGSERVKADWSTGKVGMLGASFDGSITLAAAATGVDGLEAVQPMAAVSSWYRYYRSNGLVRSGAGYLGEDIDVLYDYINSGYPERRAYCNTTYRDGEMVAGQDRVSGDYNGFWASREILDRLDHVRAAVLLYHGLNDWNVMPEHAVKAYERLKAAGVLTRLYLHDQGHAGYPAPELTNRWFSHFLYGVENGVENGPKALIVREGEDPWQPTSYADYPDPLASAVTLFPEADGLTVGALSTVRKPAQGVETLVDDVSFTSAELAQAEASEHRLIFATSPLQHDVRLSGTPTVTLRLSASKRAANLSVYLVSLPWVEVPDYLIWQNVITRGWADPQNRSSLTQGAPLNPGTFYDVTFELQPDDQVVAAGQRIGLMIFSSDRDFTLWPQPGTELAIDLDATSIKLPIVGGEGALRAALGT